MLEKHSRYILPEKLKIFKKMSSIKVNQWPASEINEADYSLPQPPKTRKVRKSKISSMDHWNVKQGGHFS